MSLRPGAKLTPRSNLVRPSPELADRVRRLVEDTSELRACTLLCTSRIPLGCIEDGMWVHPNVLAKVERRLAELGEP